MYKAQELQVSGKVGVIAEGTIATFDHNSGMRLVVKKCICSGFASTCLNS